jgi:ketosteroid isomerase-like protein
MGAVALAARKLERDTARGMSQENVEIVRAAIDAFNQRDWDAALKDVAPGGEVDMSRAVGPLHDVYRLDQMRGFIDDLAESWESLWLEAHEFTEAGEHVVVPWTLHVRGRDGIEVAARVTWVWTIRGRAMSASACIKSGKRPSIPPGLSSRRSRRRTSISCVAVGRHMSAAISLLLLRPSAPTRSPT